VSSQAVREYLQLVWQKYQAASRLEKSAILDELARNLSIHRKSAIRLMSKKYPPRSFQGFRGGRKKRYSQEAKRHLEELWKLMGYIGALRMKAALSEWIEYYKHKDFNEDIKAEIVAMSESSIKRFLEDARKALDRKRNSGTRRGLKKFIAKVPIRDFESPPDEAGHCEIDCVAHCGGSLSGSFVWTLNMTDIATGWTECEAIWGKDGASVRKALKKMENRLPFKLKALYSDNGSEFMNQDVIDWFCNHDRAETLAYYRGRPYRKNDQCYVEQKNYTHVRHLFGYGRIDYKSSLNEMNHIYRREWRQLQNFFLPQQKLIEKFRIGSRQIRKLDKAQTPFSRLKQYLSPEKFRSLELEKAALDPIRTRKTQLVKTRQIFRSYKDSIPKSERGKMSL